MLTLKQIGFSKDATVTASARVPKLAHKMLTQNPGLHSLTCSRSRKGVNTGVTDTFALNWHFARLCNFQQVMQYSTRSCNYTTLCPVTGFFTLAVPHNHIARSTSSTAYTAYFELQAGTPITMRKLLALRKAESQALQTCQFIKRSSIGS